MAPKKKGNKKGNDDWEADLGESIAPPAAGGAADAAPVEEEAATGGGGLMNLMRKNKEKRKKKGLSEDFVEGETAPGADAAVSSEPIPYQIEAKAPEEANMDDEFALPEKKGKGGKGGGKQQPAAKNAPAAKDDDETGADGRVLTKAEKEKLKKEREKQRKKEQVCPFYVYFGLSML